MHVSSVVLFVHGGVGGVPLLNFCEGRRKGNLIMFRRESRKGSCSRAVVGKTAEEMASELQVTQSSAWGESQAERAGRRTH